VPEFFQTYWPHISATAMLVAGAIAWRAEINVRLKVLEEKVRTIFEILNRK